VGASSAQAVSRELPRAFDGRLTDDERRQVRLKLDSSGVRLLTYEVARLSIDEAARRGVFEFARKLGIETLVGEPLPGELAALEKLCEEYDVKLALRNRDRQLTPQYWRPEGLLTVCQGRSQRIGACGDVGNWLRGGIDPIRAVRTLRDRVITLELHDLKERIRAGHDVAWGRGAGKTAPLLKEVQRLGLKPVMFGLEYSSDGLDAFPELAQCIDAFNAVSLEVAR